MHVLDFKEFTRAGDDGWEQFCAAVKAAVVASKAVIIRNFGTGETNERLIKLAYALGKPYGGYSLPEHPLEDGLVFRVEVRGEGVMDPSGEVIYSTTCADIPCHTDGVNRPAPYDLALLHCIRQDASGGETVLVQLDELIERLPPDVMGLLREQGYPFAFGTAPIIAGDGDEVWIRYNAQEMAFYSETGGASLSPQHRHALAKLEAALSEPTAQEKFRLSPGECLLIDNKRVLHGRSACSKGGHRLLKRVRLYW
jgi:alpha-ketoglutarate-dependent taurine dioxygenase